jgi:hypothetical protein
MRHDETHLGLPLPGAGLTPHTLLSLRHDA